MKKESTRWLVFTAKHSNRKVADSKTPALKREQVFCEEKQDCTIHSTRHQTCGADVGDLFEAEAE
jgi:hypothetical protein